MHALPHTKQNRPNSICVLYVSSHPRSAAVVGAVTAPSGVSRVQKKNSQDNVYACHNSHAAVHIDVPTSKWLPACAEAKCRKARPALACITILAQSVQYIQNNELGSGGPCFKGSLTPTNVHTVFTACVTTGIIL